MSKKTHKKITYSKTNAKVLNGAEDRSNFYEMDDYHKGTGSTYRPSSYVVDEDVELSRDDDSVYDNFSRVGSMYGDVSGPSNFGDVRHETHHDNRRGSYGIPDDAGDVDAYSARSDMAGGVINSSHESRLLIDDSIDDRSKYALNPEEVWNAANFAVNNAYLDYLGKTCITDKDMDEYKSFKNRLDPHSKGTLRRVSNAVDSVYKKIVGDSGVPEDGSVLGDEIAVALVNKIKLSLGIDDAQLCLLWDELAAQTSARLPGNDPLNELLFSKFGVEGDSISRYIKELTPVDNSPNGKARELEEAALEARASIGFDTLVSSKNPYLAALAKFATARSSELTPKEREGMMQKACEDFYLTRGKLLSSVQSKIMEDVLAKIFDDRSKIDVVLGYISDSVISGALTTFFMGTLAVGAAVRMAEERIDIPWVINMSTATTGATLGILFTQMFAVAKNSWDKRGDTFKALHAVNDSLETNKALRSLKHRMIDAIKAQDQAEFQSYFGTYIAASICARFAVNVVFNAINAMEDPNAMIGATLFGARVILAPSTFAEFKTVKRFGELLKKAKISGDFVISGCNEFFEMCARNGINVNEMANRADLNPTNDQIKAVIDELAYKMESKEMPGIDRTRANTIRDGAALCIALAVACANAGRMVTLAMAHPGVVGGDVASSTINQNNTITNEINSIGNFSSSEPRSLNPLERVYASLDTTNNFISSGILNASQIASLFLVGTTPVRAALNLARFGGSMGSGLMMAEVGNLPGVADLAGVLDSVMTLACAVGEGAVSYGKGEGEYPHTLDALRHGSSHGPLPQRLALPRRKGFNSTGARQL